MEDSPSYIGGSTPMWSNSHDSSVHCTASNEIVMV